MLLGKVERAKYGSEILALCKQELGEDVPLNQLTYFAILSGETLQAVAAVKWYMTTWYMRADVVKSEFRGNGFQRELIRERLSWLANRNDIAKVERVKVSIYPDNFRSIRNYELEDFKFEKRKKLQNGVIANVYQKQM